MIAPLFARIPSKIYISQVPFTPQGVVDGTSGLQAGVIWGLKVGSFVLSIFVLAAIIRYLLDTNNSK